MPQSIKLTFEDMNLKNGYLLLLSKLDGREVKGKGEIQSQTSFCSGQLGIDFTSITVHGDCTLITPQKLSRQFKLCLIKLIFNY